MKLKEEQQKLVCIWYLIGLSLTQCAQKFNCSRDYYHKILKKCNIPRRTISETSRKYKVNVDFFEKIDSPEKAYWLGFLTADGCVVGKYHVKLELSLNDNNHLVKFKNTLSSEHPIKYRINNRGRKCCNIKITSKKMVKDLRKLGVIPRKALVVKPYLGITQDLKEHYFRGLVDGDGCISKRRTRKHWFVGLSGTKEICEAFRTWVLSFTNCRAKVRKTYKKNGKVYNIGFSGIQLPKKIANKLYSNSSYLTSLDRKEALAKKLMEVQS